MAPIGLSLLLRPLAVAAAERRRMVIAIAEAVLHDGRRFDQTRAFEGATEARRWRDRWLARCSRAGAKGDVTLKHSPPWRETRTP